jgi:copper chaperone CopZ
MKSFKYLFTIVMLITSFDVTAQVKNKDSTVSFRVSGACEMCKERIEKSIKIRGVRSADWNVDSKMLTLVYSPYIVSLLKVHKIIAESDMIQN